LAPKPKIQNITFICSTGDNKEKKRKEKERKKNRRTTKSLVQRQIDMLQDLTSTTAHKSHKSKDREACKAC